LVENVDVGLACGWLLLPVHEITQVSPADVAYPSILSNDTFAWILDIAARHIAVVLNPWILRTAEFLPASDAVIIIATMFGCIW